MTIPNTALADVLDRRKPEEESEQLLAALIDFGVFVPVGDNGSVIFVKGSNERPAPPGYVSEECCRRRRPGATAAVHCDVTRLMDIGHHTKAEALALFSEDGWATVPFALVAQTLRDTLRDRLLDHPGVRCAWIARVRWTDTGMEQLMLHRALADAARPDTAGVLMEEVLSRIELGAETREVVVRVLRPGPDADAATMRELDTMGLDTVRADHAARRVEVSPREYDTHPAPAPAPAPERPRRWWRR
ncbi:hypothetical protein ACFYXS_38635 [Streptomyces sp. NPDC002574]|uniref:hypothetical protein n=1 Tax=Streptomyces sp. NPDC002574 TaxID=3364652 RepID=UPI0036D1D7C4